MEAEAAVQAPDALQPDHFGHAVEAVLVDPQVALVHQAGLHQVDGVGAACADHSGDLGWTGLSLVQIAKGKTLTDPMETL